MKAEKLFNTIESNIDQLIRDERFIKVVSSNLNTILKIQDYTHQKLESVLKFVDVPTLKSMDHLFETINQLEKITHDQAERIEQLEKKIEKLSKAGPKLTKPRVKKLV